MAMHDDLKIGAWSARRSTGELVRDDGRVERIEPRLMDLLLRLAREPGTVVSREAILADVWTGVVVDDDALARAVSRLRRALGDDAKSPRYVETIPKRGYRLIAPVGAAVARAPKRRAGVWAGIAAALGVAAVALVPLALGGYAPHADAKATVARADDFYGQYTRTDNEAAIELYERIIGRDPEYAPAYAGLANALVQRAIRWPGPPGSVEFTQLRDALRADALASPFAQAQLERAAMLAERAVRLAPNDAAALKALGFVASARRDFPAALAAYRHALARDPESWGVMINVGDVLEIAGDAAQAVPYFEAAYAAMVRAYPAQAARVQPWLAPLGVAIGDRYRDGGDTRNAESWYRRALDDAPLNPDATAKLAGLLRATGRAEAATRVCEDLRRRVGPREDCV